MTTLAPGPGVVNVYRVHLGCPGVAQKFAAAMKQVLAKRTAQETYRTLDVSLPTKELYALGEVKYLIQERHKQESQRRRRAFSEKE